MFRLTAYGDQPELYRYLSSIASNSICQALDDWLGTPYELEEVYLDYFTSRIGVNRMSMDDAEEAGYESFSSGTTTVSSISTVPSTSSIRSTRSPAAQALPWDTAMRT